jgi:hypothetical protein
MPSVCHLCAICMPSVCHLYDICMPSICHLYDICMPSCMPQIQLLNYEPSWFSHGKSEEPSR